MRLVFKLVSSRLHPARPAGSSDLLRPMRRRKPRPPTSGFPTIDYSGCFAPDEDAGE
ncbi:hypothetical protein V6C03_14570 [Methyloligella sp. 2.7D]|uniref:hypothetical protein n=1 Tax=unclassified Methyloligella TaxID=2625955 RepID=UPI00157CA613|nr:hypothetical protein [Methyloligella sp. GL2]QKP77024.1 hypothetical protein HT051_05895 [Methyloligella sp. GL2]